MVKFCPNCEKMLRKITEATGVYMACTSCGYRNLIEAKSQSSTSISTKSKTLTIDENPKRMKPAQPRSNFPPQKKAMPEQIEQMGQEILLLELKKKKLEAIVENLEEGRKKEEMSNEIEFLTKKHLEMLKQYKQLKKMADPTEE